MSTTFASLLTSLRLSLRDPNGTTWSDAQLGELINRGIDAIGDVYQSEAIQSTAFTQPVSGSVFSVALTTVTWPVRVDVYDGAEFIRPWGRYSMCPVIRADRAA